MINLIKEIAFFLINGTRKIIFILCMLFPVDKKKVFVNYFDGKGFGDSAKYVVLELMSRDSSYKIIWLNKKKQGKKDFLHYVKPFGFKAIYHQATSGIIISEVRMPYYSIKRKKQVYFQLWHGGVGIKKVENECPEALSPRYKRTCRHDSKMIDYFVSDNEDFTNLIINYFWYQNNEILKFGMPRLDAFYTDKYDDKTDFLKLNTNGRKICLYAPTFRNSESLEPYKFSYENLYQALKEKFGGEWVVVIRLHPRIADKSSSFITYNDHILDGSGIPDAEELLKHCDVVITDYSSIIFDFLVTKKPGFLYATDILEYTKERDFHLRLEDTPYTIAKNEKELMENIRSFDEDAFKKRVDAFNEEIGFYTDGRSSEKIVDIILNGK